MFPGLLRHLRKSVDRIIRSNHLGISRAREGAIGPRPVQTGRRRPTLERPPGQKDTIRSLRTELGELRKEVVRRGKQIVQLDKRLDQEKERSESLRETGRTLSHESLRLHSRYTRARVR